MENYLNNLIKTRNNWIPFENLEINEYLTSGGSCEIYKGKLKSNKIIIKMLDSTHYHYENDIINDISDELDIYDKIHNKNQLCYCYGFSFSNLNKSYQLYILLKDYNINYDFNDFIKNNTFWKKYSKDKILDKYQYYYNYRNSEWIYNLDRDFKIHLTHSLCNAVKSLHNENIVHCDLKLNNMLIVNDEIILIDFGVSHFLNKEKTIIVEEDIGTLGYMCEELQFGICSKKSDIYSLGVCILELWVGEIWQEGNNYQDCRKEILNSLKYLEKKENILAKIIKKCILKKSSKRPYINTIIKTLVKVF